MARILDNLRGHREQIEFLLNAVESGRLPSTLLLVGPSGIGKRQLALGLAQARLCPVDHRACGLCPSCLRVEKGESESLMMVGGDHPIIRIEASREIMRFLALAGLGSAQIVIVDDAQTLNVQAANALLKVLEEPPPHTHFFLLVPSLAGVLPTIRSRSQVVRMAPLSDELMRELRPGLDAWIYRAAQGSVALADQMQGEEWSQLRQKAYRLWVSLWDQDREKAFALIAEVTQERETALFVVRCWQGFLRDVWVMRDELGPAWEPLLESERGKWQGLSDFTLREVTDSIWAMERLLQQNVDRQVLFESVWLTTRRLLAQEEPGFSQASAGG